MISKCYFACFLFLTVVNINLYAQRETVKSNFDTTDYSKIILSGTLSTQGFGADIKVLLKPEFGIRTGVSILPFNWQTVYKGRSLSTNMELDADFANAHMMLDWQPLTSRQNILNQLVVTAGVAYWWKNQGQAVISYDGPYRFGDIVIPPDELGELIGEVKWNKVTPYLGFGLQQIFSSRKVSLGAAVGLYYMGEPETRLTGTKLLSNNTSNSEQFRKNMSFYRFLPVLQLNLNLNL